MAKILVIDDNEALRKMVARMLQGAGHEVVSAGDGKRGIALFEEQSPDLVITDILMPDMDGVETVTSLRRITPDVKIILMSGGGEAGSGREYLESTDAVLDVPHVIAKPFEQADLLNMVNEVL